MRLHLFILATFVSTHCLLANEPPSPQELANDLIVFTQIAPGDDQSKKIEEHLSKYKSSWDLSASISKESDISQNQIRILHSAFALLNAEQQQAVTAQWSTLSPSLWSHASAFFKAKEMTPLLRWLIQNNQKMSLRGEWQHATPKESPKFVWSQPPSEVVELSKRVSSYLGEDAFDIAYDLNLSPNEREEFLKLDFIDAATGGFRPISVMLDPPTLNGFPFQDLAAAFEAKDIKTAERLTDTFWLKEPKKLTQHPSRPSVKASDTAIQTEIFKMIQGLPLEDRLKLYESFYGAHSDNIRLQHVASTGLLRSISKDYLEFVLEHNETLSASPTQTPEGAQIWSSTDPLFNRYLRILDAIYVGHGDYWQSNLEEFKNISDQKKSALLDLSVFDSNKHLRPVMFLTRQAPQPSVQDFKWALQWTLQNLDTDLDDYSKHSEQKREEIARFFKTTTGESYRHPLIDLEVVSNHQKLSFYREASAMRRREFLSAWEALDAQSRETLLNKTKNELKTEALNHSEMPRFRGPIREFPALKHLVIENIRTQALELFFSHLKSPLELVFGEGSIDVNKISNTNLKEIITLTQLNPWDDLDSVSETYSWNALIGQLPLEKRQELISYSITNRMDVFKTVTLGETLFNIGQKGLMKADLIERILKHVVSIQRNAIYDGAAQKHVYQDRVLEQEVYFLSMAALQAPEEMRRALNSLTEDERQEALKDTNTAMGESRVEVMDLIVQAMKEQLPLIALAADDDAPIPTAKPVLLSDFFRTAYREVADPSTEPKLIVIKERLGTGFTLLCSEPNLRIINDSAHRMNIGSSSIGSWGISFVQMSPLVNSQSSSDLRWGSDLQNESSKAKEFAAWSGTESAQVLCGNKVFDVKVNAEKLEGQLPLPVDPLLQQALKGNEIKITGAYALPGETDQRVALGAAAFLATQGYRLVTTEKIEDFKPTLINDLKDTQMFIPSSHAMNLNIFVVGTQKARRMKFEKSIPHPQRPEEELKINFDVYLPDMNASQENPVVMLSSEELEEIFCARRTPDGLFVMNISCDSEETIDSWMMAYRNTFVDSDTKTFKRNPQEAIDVPTILAASRGFDTNNPATILGHLQYPVDVIERVVRGQSTTKIIDSLNQERQTSSLIKIAQAILNKTNKVEATTRSFNPVCNIQHPEVFSFSGGFQVEVKDQANPESKTLY